MSPGTTAAPARQPLNQRDTPRSTGPFWLLVPLGILCYANTLAVPFVFDDHAMITANEAVTGPLDMGEIWRFHPGRFVTFLSLALNHMAGGLQVWGYHLVNLAIHLAAALVLGWLIRLLFSANAGAPEHLRRQGHSIAMLAAILFVAHPVQTQAVTYIWQRSTSLAALFYLLSLALFVRARLGGQAGTGKPVIHFWVGSLVCGLLAMFTKEISFTLPLAIAAVEVFLLRACARAPRWFYAPYALLLAIIPLSYLLSLGLYQERAGETAMAPLTYLFTQVSVTLTYLRLFLLPLGQNLDYDYPLAAPTPVFVLEAMLLLGILILAVVIARRDRWLSAGLLFFFLTLAVEAGAFTLPDVIFEHRLYLPMAGLCLFAATVLVKMVAGRTALLWTVFVLAAVIPGLLTWQRNQVWRSADALWADTLAKSPRKARVWASLGQVHYRAERWPAALADFNRALELDASYLPALSLRATLHQRMGNTSAALADYDRFLAHNQDLATVYNNRGSILLANGALEKARTDFDKALALAPDYAVALANRGQVHLQRQRFDAAVADLQRAVALAPQAAKPWFYLGLCYEKKGDASAALAAYADCLKRDPTMVRAHLNAGLLRYSSLADLAGALASIDQALILEPSFAAGYRNRGAIYYNERRYEEALVDFDRLVDLTASGEAYYRRGLVLLELRRWEAAGADVRKAAEMGVDIPEKVTGLLQSRPP